MMSGQLFVALDFFRTAQKAAVDWGSAKPPVLPEHPRFAGPDRATTAGHDAVGQCPLQKLNALPLDQLSADAGAAMRSLDATLKSIDRQLNDD